VIHQRLNLVPALSAIENVALPLRLEGMARSRALAAATEALAEADAAGFAGARVDRLSTGQQQRVALARATVGGREIVLADEPTAALDTVGTERVAELLSKLAEAGRAVLMVTHDSRLATWADRVIVLRDGRVVDRLDPQLTSDPAAAVR
jgi:putative ABC transport system ATP-binding protein